MSALHELSTPVTELLSRLPFDRKPRILYLITRAERGGAQTHVLDLALGLRDIFDVHLATGEEGFLTEACRTKGLPVHVLPSLEREIRPWSDLKATLDLRSLLLDVKPDLVHAHTFKAGFLGRLVARLLKIPAVYTVHMWPFGRAVPLSWRLVAPVCERLAARWCDKIISVSVLGVHEAARFDIGSSFQVVSILNGIEDHPGRARLSHDGPKSCTMVARFTEFKDHTLLLRAFAQVPGDTRLKLVGDGHTLPAAIQLSEDLNIRDRVEFLGSRGDVPEILADTDIFVLASKTETLPISILEAMRAGLPVISTDVGGVSEEVINGETGILVAPGSVSEMAVALERLLSDKELRLSMGRSGRKRFEAFFRADQMRLKTAAVYAGVIEERQAQ